MHREVFAFFFFFWIQHLKAASGAIEIDGNFSVAKQKLIANAERMRQSIFSYAYLKGCE